jgi:lysyl-tRNA synthetase class 1
VQKNVSEDVKNSLTKEQKRSLEILKERLSSKDYDETSLYNDFMDICKEANTNPADFFKAAYKIILNKERGPKLAGFIMLLGKDKVVELLKNI